MGIDETEKRDQSYDLDQMADNTKDDSTRACSWLTLLHVLIQPLKSLEKSLARRCTTVWHPDQVRPGKIN